VHIQQGVPRVYLRVYLREDLTYKEALSLPKERGNNLCAERLSASLGWEEGPLRREALRLLRMKGNPVAKRDFPLPQEEEKRLKGGPGPRGGSHPSGDYSRFTVGRC